MKTAFAGIALCSAAVHGQDIDLASCAPPPALFEFNAATGIPLDGRIGILNAAGGNLYLAFDANPYGSSAGAMCTAGTHLFTCNGVSIELPADPATTVPPTAQVVLHGRPTAAGQFGFKIIATPANGVGGCTREYRLNIVLATDTQAPTVPAGLSATLLPSNVIRLNWSASTDNVMVTGYLLRQTIGTGATAVTLDRPAVNALTFDVAGVAPGKLYTYLVRAVDAAGNSSAFSQPAVLSTPVAAGPSPPSSLIVN